MDFQSVIGSDLSSALLFPRSHHSLRVALLRLALVEVSVLHGEGSLVDAVEQGLLASHGRQVC